MTLVKLGMYIFLFICACAIMAAIGMLISWAMDALNDWWEEYTANMGEEETDEDFDLTVVYDGETANDVKWEFTPDTDNELEEGEVG